MQIIWQLAVLYCMAEVLVNIMLNYTTVDGIVYAHYVHRLVEQYTVYMIVCHAMLCFVHATLVGKCCSSCVRVCVA